MPKNNSSRVGKLYINLINTSTVWWDEEIFLLKDFLFWVLSRFSHLSFESFLAVRINHSRKLMDRCLGPWLRFPGPFQPLKRGVYTAKQNSDEIPENLVVFVDVSPFPKGKNLQVPCVQFSMSKNRFLCQPAPLSSTSVSGNPRFFCNLSKN